MRRNDWLVGQLPVGMTEDGFFVRFVSLFQDLATGLMEGVDNIPNAVDVTVAPPALVRWLGSWIGVGNIDSSLPVDLQRRIVRESAKILAWRGTRKGLVRWLELMTDGPVEVTDSGGVFPAGEVDLRPAQVSIKVDSTGWVPERDFVALIRDELPANVTFEVYVRDRRLWPPVYEVAAPAAAPMASPAPVPITIQPESVSANGGAAWGAPGTEPDPGGGAASVTVWGQPDAWSATPPEGPATPGMATADWPPPNPADWMPYPHSGWGAPEPWPDGDGVAPPPLAEAPPSLAEAPPPLAEAPPPLAEARPPDESDGPDDQPPPPVEAP